VACAKGEAEVAELLLHGGADPNIRDHLGNCAILEAVKTAHDRCLQVNTSGSWATGCWRELSA
jgi:ankyrin repeat protein